MKTFNVAVDFEVIAKTKEDMHNQLREFLAICFRDYGATYNVTDFVVFDAEEEPCPIH